MSFPQSTTDFSLCYAIYIMQGQILPSLLLIVKSFRSCHWLLPAFLIVHIHRFSLLPNPQVLIYLFWSQADLQSTSSLTKAIWSQTGRYITFMALFRSVPELWKQPFSFCFWVSQIKASWMCFSYMKMYGRAWAKDLRTKAVSLKAREGTETAGPVSVTGDGAHADITALEESSRSSRSWLCGLVGNYKLA